MRPVASSPAWRDRFGPARSALLLAVLALASSACSSEAPAGDPKPEVVVAAPPEAPDAAALDFTLARLGGGSVTLSALRGKTVVLDFWATWCPPCEFQVPPLNEFYRRHRADGDLEVFGVSIDSEGVEIVATWVAEKRVGYPILLDGEELARRYGAQGFPTLIVVGPDGRIASQHVGLIESDTLEKALATQRVRSATAEAGSPAARP